MDTKQQLQEQCAEIARGLDAIADGEAYKLGEDGEQMTSADVWAELLKTEGLDALAGVLGIGEEEARGIGDPVKEEMQTLIDAGLCHEYTMGDYINLCCYDVDYTVDAHGGYKGAELLVAGGGPNIYVNTRRGRVEGYWWGDEATAKFDKDAADALDEYLAEQYETVR